MASIFGIGVKFTFDSRQALAALKKTDKAFRALGKSVQKQAAALKPLASGLKKVALVGFAVVGATMIKAISVAANFEQQMSAVKAVSNATASDMAKLTMQAKKLGATTSFSAIQAAQGQEILARAGFSTTEIMGALPGVLNAAAAEGMDLATSAGIVANTLRGFNMPASKAGHVADVLAKAASMANTDMRGLGEGLIYSQAQFASMGVSLESTVAMLGKVADAGIKASMGGTSLVSAFVKIIKPSKEGEKILKKWNVSLTDAQGKMRPMGKIIDDFAGGLDSVKDEAEKSRIATEVFGIRGQKAMNALKTAGGESLESFREALVNSTGAASKMAQERLNNLKGAFTLFRSAMEGFFVETGSVFLKPLTEGLQKVTKFLSDVTLVLQGNEEDLKDVSGEARIFAGVVTAALASITAAFKSIKENWKPFVTDIMPSLLDLSHTLLALFDNIKDSSKEAGGPTKSLAGIIIALTKTLDFLINAGVFVSMMLKPLGAFLGWVGVQFWKMGTFVSDTIKRFKEASKSAQPLRNTLKVLGTTLKTLFSPLEKVKQIFQALTELFPSLQTGWNNIEQAFHSFVQNPATQKAIGFLKTFATAGLIKPPKIGAPGGAAPVGGAPPARAPASANIREVGAANVGRRAAPVRVELGGADSSVQKVIIENRLMLDGKQIAHNLARQELNLKERSGGRVTPGQRRQALELGRITPLAAT